MCAGRCERALSRCTQSPGRGGSACALGTHSRMLQINYRHMTSSAANPSRQRAPMAHASILTYGWQRGEFRNCDLDGPRGTESMNPIIQELFVDDVKWSDGSQASETHLLNDADPRAQKRMKALMHYATATFLQTPSMKASRGQGVKQEAAIQRSAEDGSKDRGARCTANQAASYMHTRGEQFAHVKRPVQA